MTVEEVVDFVQNTQRNGDVRVWYGDADEYYMTGYDDKDGFRKFVWIQYHQNHHTNVEKIVARFSVIDLAMDFAMDLKNALVKNGIEARVIE
jgi:hypothetical protein